jgi:hypothetical protein
MAIGVISVAVLGITFATDLVPAAPHGVAYLLIFAGAVCALPRMALRVAIKVAHSKTRSSLLRLLAFDSLRAIAALAILACA